jgi:hypothetical protein
MQLIRGDSLLFKSLLKRADGIVIQKEDLESLFVTIKNSEYSKEYIIQKNINEISITSDGYAHIILNPEETSRLEQTNYKCDIEVTLKNGIRKTKLFSINVVNDITTHGGDSNE